MKPLVRTPLQALQLRILLTLDKYNLKQAPDLHQLKCRLRKLLSPLESHPGYQQTRDNLVQQTLRQNYQDRQERILHQTSPRASKQLADGSFLLPTKP